MRRLVPTRRPVAAANTGGGLIRSTWARLAVALLLCISAIAPQSAALAQQAEEGQPLTDAQMAQMERAAELHKQASEAFLAGDQAVAVESMAEVVRIARSVLGSKDPDTITAIGNYAGMLDRVGWLDEAAPAYAEAISSGREVFGDRDPDTIAAMASYASVLMTLGRVDEAEPLFAEVLQHDREVLGYDNSDTLTSIDNHADALERLNKFGQAEPLRAEALSLRRQSLGNTAPETLVSMTAHANVLGWLGMAADAEVLYAEVLAARRSIYGNDDPETLTSAANYAVALSDLGRFVEAEALHADTLRQRRSVLGERHPDTLASLNYHAVVLLDLMRYDQGQALLQELLPLQQEVLGSKHPDTIQTLANLAAASEPQGSVPLYEQAVPLVKEVYGPTSPEALIVLSGYSGALQNVDRNEEAAEIQLSVLQARRQLYGNHHRETVQSLNAYARILQSLGRLDEAEPFSKDALHYARETMGGNHPYTLIATYDHIALLLELDNTREALPLLKTLATGLRARSAGLADQSLRGDAQRNREAGDRRYVEALLADTLWANREAPLPDFGKPVDEAFTALQLASAGTTSRAVAEAAALRFASGAGLQELVKERQALVREWGETETKLLGTQGDSEQARDQRQSLEQRFQAIEGRMAAIDVQLAQDAPQYFAILSQDAVKIDALRAILQEDEALLLLVPTESGTHSLAVTQQGSLWRRADTDKHDMARAITEFRDGLEIRADTQYLPFFDPQLAHQLYADLIAPVEETLAGKKRVYVVADGALSRIPLGTLIASAPADGMDPDDPDALRELEWLADRYALVQLPSLQSLVYIRNFALEDKSSDGPSFSGFGNPILGGQSTLRGARSATLAPVDAAALASGVQSESGGVLMDPEALKKLSSLPGTESELEQVRAALGAPESALRLGEEMTESSIRQADLSTTRILHVATHGFTSEESGGTAEPGLVFTPPSEARPEDDGYLAASEVVEINLTAAELIILSACNTASPSGKAGESGLSGLAQAFFYAGAESLLVSHWPVFDDIAPALTVEMLKRTELGQQRAEALQAAIRTIREDPEFDAAHPAVWAPFTLVGEGV